MLPLESWPLFGFRRRAYRARGWRWHAVPEHAVPTVLARLRAEGPMTVTELGGARRTTEWWDWSEVKVAVEWLLDVGEVVCTTRRGWRRVYDLPERALPAELLADEPDDDACLRALVAQAGRALGVGTRADLADVHRLKGEQVDAVVADTGLVAVEVEGWGVPAWADPAALEAPSRGRHRTTLLSPFDSLVVDRRRTERVFAFAHRLEAYAPAARREHGYVRDAAARRRAARRPRRSQARGHDAARPRAERGAAGDRGDGRGAARGGGVGRVRRGRAGPVEPAGARAPLAAALA